MHCGTVLAIVHFDSMYRVDLELASPASKDI